MSKGSESSLSTQSGSTISISTESESMTYTRSLTSARSTDTLSSVTFGYFSPDSAESTLRTLRSGRRMVSDFDSRRSSSDRSSSGRSSRSGRSTHSRETIASTFSVETIDEIIGTKLPSNKFWGFSYIFEHKTNIGIGVRRNYSILSECKYTSPK